MNSRASALKASSGQRNHDDDRGHGSLQRSRQHAQSHGGLQIERSFLSLHQACDSNRTMYDRGQAIKYRIHKFGCDCRSMAIQRINQELAASSDVHKKQSLLIVPYNPPCTNIWLFSQDETRLDLEAKLQEAIDVDRSKALLIQNFHMHICACLLKETQHGIVCIQSSLETAVERLRDESRRNFIAAPPNQRFKDHAHHVAVVPWHMLLDFFDETQMSHQTQEPASDALRERLQHQLGQQITVKGFKIQSHLERMIQVAKNETELKKECFWLVMIYDDTDRDDTFALDLPGGRRLLGETSWAAAIRETQEEVSLNVRGLPLVYQKINHTGMEKHFVLAAPES